MPGSISGWSGTVANEEKCDQVACWHESGVYRGEVTGARLTSRLVGSRPQRR